MSSSPENTRGRGALSPHTCISFCSVAQLVGANHGDSGTRGHSPKYSPTCAMLMMVHHACAGAEAGAARRSCLRKEVSPRGVSSSHPEPQVRGGWGGGRLC